MNKGMHRTPAGTKLARQLAALNGVPLARTVAASDEQAEWNARIEAERAAKKQAKKNGKGNQS